MTHAFHDVPHVLRALVVESDDDTRDLIVALLDRSGYDVVEADTGEDLLEWVSSPSPAALDAIVSDVQLPDLSADEVVTALCSRGRKAIPVILVSPMVDEELRRQAYAVGDSCAALERPFDGGDLRALLRGLEWHSGRHAAARRYHA